MFWQSGRKSRRSASLDRSPATLLNSAPGAGFPRSRFLKFTGKTVDSQPPLR